LRQRRERWDRAADPQFGHASAPDQLLGLREKFDFADTAASEFHVVARDRDLAAAAMRVDLALDRMNILDRGEIETAPPEIGPQLGQEGAARLAVAGDRRRLDQRRALPVLSRAFVIGQ